MKEGVNITVRVSDRDHRRLLAHVYATHQTIAGFLKALVAERLDALGIDDHQADRQRPAKRRPTLRRLAATEALADAANRVPVKISFARKHDYIPWGIRQTLWDNGLTRYGQHDWVGRLRPAQVEVLSEAVQRHEGRLIVTGGLGEPPRRKPQPRRRVNTEVFNTKTEINGHAD